MCGMLAIGNVSLAGVSTAVHVAGEWDDRVRGDERGWRELRAQSRVAVACTVHHTLAGVNSG
eukprot:455378-Prymnesium_polylepis.1